MVTDFAILRLFEVRSKNIFNLAVRDAASKRRESICFSELLRTGEEIAHMTVVT